MRAVRTPRHQGRLIKYHSYLLPAGYSLELATEGPQRSAGDQSDGSPVSDGATHLTQPLAHCVGTHANERSFVLSDDTRPVFHREALMVLGGAEFRVRLVLRVPALPLPGSR